MQIFQKRMSLVYVHATLGIWLASFYHRWKLYYDMPNDLIYERSGNSWISYFRQRVATRTNPIYLQRFTTNTIALFIALTTVIFISEGLVMFEGEDYMEFLPISRTFDLNCYVYRILENSNIKAKYKAPCVTEELNHDTLLAVCDGAYNLNLAPNGLTPASVIKYIHQQIRYWVVMQQVVSLLITIVATL